MRDNPYKDLPPLERWKGKYAHVKVPAGSANAGAKTGGDQDA